MKVINELKGLRNTREIGGYINKNGQKLVNNKFIRSCELSKLSKKDLKKFVCDYNIKTVVDFRTDVELKKKPIPTMPSQEINVVHLPILEDENLGIPRNFKQFKKMWKTVMINNTSPDEFLKNMYLNMAFSDYSANKYKDFFDIILKNPEGAILYNCTEGKDRTGIATMLLLSCLDFDKDVILEDYITSKEFCDKKMEIYRKRCKRMFICKKITNFVTGIMATKEIFLNAVFEKIEEDFNTVENYLINKIKLTNTDLQNLKSLFLI